MVRVRTLGRVSAMGAVVVLGLGLAACSASSSTTTGNNSGGSASGGGGAGGGTGGSVGGNGGEGGDINIGGLGGGGTGGGGTSCVTGPDEDADGDGFSVNQGDCNDCDANVSPNGLEVVITEPDDMGNIPEPADEDCDGVVDNPPPDTCDQGFALDDLDAMHGAMAIDLCKVSSGPNDWGVVSAAYTRADGVLSPHPAPNALQIGLLDNFGSNVIVQKGERMLGLSSGFARDVADPNNCLSSSGGLGGCSCTSDGSFLPPAGTAPDVDGDGVPDFPQEVPGCAVESAIHDDVALDLTLRAPSNATGYRFLFKFYSFEFPEYVCTSFNDQFIALVSPAPVGSQDGNISFDSSGNPVSVNIGFFDVCDSSLLQYYSAFGNPLLQPPPGTCSSGAAELFGTGFGVGEFGNGCSAAGPADAGGTSSWLQTSAPIGGGEEFQLRFIVWDTGDASYDSTVLVDGFEWVANGGTVVVGTEPPPPPN